ncbi:MAG: hypothetical protein AB7D07_16330 [Desulfovibrionaceae bacterium]
MSNRPNNPTHTNNSVMKLNVRTMLQRKLIRSKKLIMVSFSPSGLKPGLRVDLKAVEAAGAL